MKVGVTGVGTMSGGIAQAFAQIDGYEVYLCDLTDAFAEGGRKRVKKGLAGRVVKGKFSQGEMGKILDCIHTGTKDICKDYDLVTKAVTENIQIKKQTFRELSGIRKKDRLFATNTSSLSITKAGAGLDHPMTGMHFFNPAPVMKLVEVISGLGTPQEDLDRITKTTKDIDKTVVPMQEFAGFIVDHILVPMISEAVGVYVDNGVPAEKIGEAMKFDANHPIGPLTLDDLIDLDVMLAIMGVLQSETGDTECRPYPELREVVRGDRLGKKTGRGFYNYTK